MLVRAMDGDLWLDPRASGGTVATLRLQRERPSRSPRYAKEAKA